MEAVVGARQTPSSKQNSVTGPSAKVVKRQSARERIAAARAIERRKERLRWIVTFAVTGIVVAVLAVGAALALVKQDREAKRPAALPTPVERGSETLPPWPVPADPVAGARQAGLDVKPMEGTAKHFHAHLDILVNGKAVPVPADLGVSPAEGAMSELHTHDTRGVLHIEAPTANKRYITGQLFNEWQVKLSPTGIGGLKTDGKNTLTAYVDGKRWTGDPAAIELVAHRQIALVYGPKDAKVKVPSSYNFGKGE
jgi:hypothetical protein